jgi:hypothetical protein
VIVLGRMRVIVLLKMRLTVLLKIKVMFLIKKWVIVSVSVRASCFDEGEIGRKSG